MLVLKKIFFTVLFATLTTVCLANTIPWKTYTDKKQDFKISYPATLVTRKQFSGAYFFTKGWSVDLHQDNNPSQLSLFEIQLQNFHGSDKNHEGYYYNSFVRVGLSTAPDDLANCEKPSNTLTIDKPATVILNGKKFYVFSVADAAMSQYLLGVVYRRLEQQKCYSVEYLETGSNNQDIPLYTTLKNRSRILGKKLITTFSYLN